MKHLHRMMISTWPTLLILAVIGLICYLAGAQWPTTWHVDAPIPPPAQLELIRTGQAPDTFGLEDFLIFLGIVAFLWIKDTTIVRNMTVVDWFAITLVAANAVFSLLYGLILTNVLFPYWFFTHPGATEWLRTGLRVILLAVLVWGILTLTNVPSVKDKPIARWENLMALFSHLAFVGVVLLIIWG